MAIAAAQWQERLASIPRGEESGRILAFNGLVVESVGPTARVGDLCRITTQPGMPAVTAEVMGFRDERLMIMPYGHMRGISSASRVVATGRQASVPVGPGLLGRVVNAFCEPLDGREPPVFPQEYPLYRDPINALDRAPIDTVLETGIRVIDTLLTMGVGQRMGIFAGSGVGKSTLLGMLARQVSADVTILALIGERGREVGDFLRDSLGQEGLKRSVVIVATADEPAVVRAHCAYAAHAIAEYFRDQGKNVLLVVDSMTRFAMAQREIGLAVGEPPTFRGYTPSVFGKLPSMLERCGRLRSGGAISGIYSVLVEGDDMNEPVTDHMRAILDGHITLSREIAARHHYPAIDVLHSTSRVMSHVAAREECEVAANARKSLATYEASRDLIELGAYQAGSNPKLDRAIAVQETLEQFLQQETTARAARQQALQRLGELLVEGVR